MAAPAYADASQEQLLRDLQNMNALQMRSTSLMMTGRHVRVASPAYTNMDVPKAQGNVFTYFGSQDSRKKRTWASDQLFLSGENLMSTGSRYASNTDANSSFTAPQPGRPRRVSPDDPVPGPFETPLSDALWPLLALALAYGAYLILSRKREGMKD